MIYEWHDFIGNLGVALIVVSYYSLQIGRTTSKASSYLWANATGASLVLVSLLGEFNLSAFLVEIFWLLISIYGLYKKNRLIPE
ncbi:MAG: hypothetical protein HOL98_04615 [Gammaproteobacteria bacterium]|jgi:hypothetical protein|nr:hypothetical protein [Gammaproteobacteria bacterium]MBT5202719.1 hypothetical protein [Gammaproteobacteria bacterium]MBT5603136.1 hypothetical protein [Gammaproteobacteria bacterium]MBT6245066.1 hypothetical protein [Gammaproteobacteria bacterium]